MSFVPFNGSGGGGSSSDDCTATKAQWRAGYTAIGLNTDDEPVNGEIADYSGATSWTPNTGTQTIPIAGKYAPTNITVNPIPSQRSSSGNVTLTASNTNVSYAAGWYDNAHGAAINAQTKSTTPTTSAQTISPDSGKVLGSVTVNAIPSQKSDSGYVTLNTGTRSKNYSAGWYSNEHGAQIQTQGKNVTPSTSAQTVTPDTNYVLSAVSVSAIPNQTAGGTVTLTASTTSASRSSGIWLTSAFTVNVSVYDGSYS